MVSELTQESVIGDRVRWETIGGNVYDGILIEWDNCTAIVQLDDGTTKAVQA